MKHSGYLTTSGAEIYYEQYGSGTPLLILHGNSQSLAVFYPFLRTFLPDFQVILMDSRGHGRSRLSVHTALHGFSTEDMADDVIALLNHLHLSSVHLLGFSDGANIGLEIACKYPERLKKLICISANASPDGLLTPLHLAAQMLHSILNLLGNLLLPVLKCSFSSASASSGSSVVSALCTPKVSLPFQKNFSVSATSAVCADKERQCHFGSIFPRIPAEQKKKPDFLTRLTHRVLRRRNLTSLLLHSPRLSARKLQTISVPVLLIAGTRDLIKPSHSRWLARQIPTSRLLLMTGGRHTSIFRTPAPYLRAILSFLCRSLLTLPAAPLSLLHSLLGSILFLFKHLYRTASAATVFRALNSKHLSAQLPPIIHFFLLADLIQHPVSIFQNKPPIFEEIFHFPGSLQKFSGFFVIHIVDHLSMDQIPDIVAVVAVLILRFHQNRIQKLDPFHDKHLMAHPAPLKFRLKLLLHLLAQVRMPFFQISIPPAFLNPVI